MKDWVDKYHEGGTKKEHMLQMYTMHNLRYLRTGHDNMSLSAGNEQSKKV